MKRIFFVLLLAKSACLIAIAQEPPRIIPPTPEATAAFKFSEVPMSTYTGLPNISIPIHEIKCGNLTIPISLSYHARGIKVDEMSSWTGLGWSLGYGGMISRQIRGREDEGPFGYLTQSYYNGVFSNTSLRASMLADLLNNDIDMVPDQFMFDANGTSGKFVFNQVTGEVVLQEYKDIEISKILESSEIVGWVLTDDAGNKFYFGKSMDGQRTAYDYDFTWNTFTYSSITQDEAQSGMGDDPKTISAWHLMDIVTPSGETVSFGYDLEQLTFYRHSYDENRIPNSEVVSHYSLVSTYQNQISTITYAGGKMYFTPLSTGREDVNGGYALDKIAIANEKDSIVKEFQFAYYYTTSPTNGNQLNRLKSLDSPSSKRLFLSSIQQKGISGEMLPPYTFEYDPTILPNRFSTSQDGWGFYNGANNGEYLTFFATSSNVDRSVNEALTGAGNLKKITYPSGGSVEFTYEQNAGIPPAYFESLLFPSLNKIESQTFLAQMLMGSEYLIDDGVYALDSIVIGEEIEGDVEFTFQLSFCPSEEELEPECVYSVRLISQGGANTYNLYPMVNNERTRYVAIPPGMYKLIVEQNNPALEGSLFYVKLKWDETVTTIFGGTSDPTALMPAGGQRIKRIEYKESESSTPLIKEYEYLTPDSLSSGVILGPPGFYSLNPYISEGIPSPYYMTSDKYGCVAGGPLSTYQGNSISYTHVTEYQGTKENNVGKTDYEFTTVQDGGSYYKWPYHMPTDTEWLRGRPKSTKTYRRNGSGAYELLKVVENKYIYADTLFAPSIYLDGTEPVHIDSVAPTYYYYVNRSNFKIPLILLYDVNDVPLFKVYYETGGTCDLYSTKESYYEDGAVNLESETRYYYDHDSHYQLKGSVRALSDSTQEITVMTYPVDYPQGTDFIDEMVLKNLVAYPIEKVNYQEKDGNSTILSGVVTTYDDTNPERPDEVFTLENDKPISLATFKFSNKSTGALPFSGSISAFSPDSGYKPKIKYDLYDSKGNVLQYTTTDNISVCYLWGYNQRFPVAEIRNATYSDVLAVLGQIVINDLNEFPGTDSQMRQNLEPLYTAPSLKGALISICTYDTSFGPTSVTDVNGTTTYYKYDNIGRLTIVEDKDHNVVKQIRYHYALDADQSPYH